MRQKIHMIDLTDFYVFIPHVFNKSLAHGVFAFGALLMGGFRDISGRRFITFIVAKLKTHCNSYSCHTNKCYHSLILKVSGRCL